ncbi:MAG TPA: TetR/AcrR family transcriptional regulator [Solirubrobacteraceae bacterium]|nr:TetR/AcrR family transcriptional regulator [Solirubrobacteraceae bacterium]
MVVSTALLIRERGARATSIADVLAHSGAPRGSAYHYFPGGRTQLLGEATDYAGEYVARRIRRAGSAREAFDALIEYYRVQLSDTEFRAGCPVVAVAVESGSEAEPELRERAAAAFALWTQALAELLVNDGLAELAAAELAVLLISAIEGALVLARAGRDTEPLDVVHRYLRSLLPERATDRST